MKRALESGYSVNGEFVIYPRKCLVEMKEKKIQKLAHRMNALERICEEGITRQILSFLNVKEHHLVKSCCRRWKELIETLDIEVLDLSVKSPLHAKNIEAAFLSTINSYSEVRVINFSGQRSLCDRDLLVLTSCFWSTLEKVVVDDCLAITDFGLLAILNAQSQRLHTVSMRNCKLITGRFSQDCITGQHPSLTHLDFHNTRVSYALVNGLEDRFPSLQSIVATHTPAHFDYFRHSEWLAIHNELVSLVTSQHFNPQHFNLLLQDFNQCRLDVLNSAQSCSVFMKSLLSIGNAALIDVPLDSENYNSSLLYACDNDLEQIVPYLLEKGDANIEVTDKDGATPLCVAATTGMNSTVKLLLAKGANINARTYSLATPLYFASEMDWDEVVATLLENNAHTDSRAIGGTTALCVAAKNGSRSTVRQLISRNMTLTANSFSSPNNMQEFILALCLACERSHYEIVEDLLNTGLDPNVVMENGVTPLYLACQMGHDDVVELLLQRGANPNFRRLQGVSCLYIAAQEGKSGVVERLIKYGVDTLARMDDLSSALHIAARMGHTHIVDVLICVGADMNSQTRSGLTPLYIAC